MSIDFNIVAVGSDNEFFLIQTFRIAETELEIYLVIADSTVFEFCSGDLLEIISQFLCRHFYNRFGVFRDQYPGTGFAVFGNFKLCTCCCKYCKQGCCKQ